MSPTPLKPMPEVRAPSWIDGTRGDYVAVAVLVTLLVHAALFPLVERFMEPPATIESERARELDLRILPKQEEEEPVEQQFIVANPDVHENPPDEAPFFATRDQQAAQENPVDHSDHPLPESFDEEETQSNAVVEGELEQIPPMPSGRPGLIVMPSPAREARQAQQPTARPSPSLNPEQALQASGQPAPEEAVAAQATPALEEGDELTRRALQGIRIRPAPPPPPAPAVALVEPEVKSPEGVASLLQPSENPPSNQSGPGEEPRDVYATLVPGLGEREEIPGLEEVEPFDLLLLGEDPTDTAPPAEESPAPQVAAVAPGTPRAAEAPQNNPDPTQAEQIAEAAEAQQEQTPSPPNPMQPPGDMAEPRPRPRVRPQVAPSPLLNNPLGVSRAGTIAVDSQFSEYGDYLQRAVDAISVKWTQLILATIRSNPGTRGTVVVEFTLDKEGYVTTYSLEHSSADRLRTLIVEDAIKSLAPYGVWTADMVATLGEEQRIRFTFYYR